MTADTTLMSNSFAALSLIAAPAVLTNAASLLAMSTSNRFLRAGDRMRGLAQRLEAPGESDAVRRLLLTQVERVERQASLLLAGLRATYVALGSFATASLISVVGAACSARGLHYAESVAVALALAAGFFGAGGMVHGCFNLFRTTRLSMLNIAEEAEWIRSRAGERTS